MKIEFDPQADTAYIELIEGGVERSKQIEQGIIAYSFHVGDSIRQLLQRNAQRLGRLLQRGFAGMLGGFDLRVTRLSHAHAFRHVGLSQH